MVLDSSMDDKTLARIQEMEHRFDHVRAVADALDKTLSDYEEAQRRIRELEAYQASGRWLADFEADERGELPKGLPRGVLSEDGLDTLFTDLADLRARMASLSKAPEEEDTPVPDKKCP